MGENQIFIDASRFLLRKDHLYQISSKSVNLFKKSPWGDMDPPPWGGRGREFEKLKKKHPEGMHQGICMPNFVMIGQFLVI